MNHKTLGKVHFAGMRCRVLLELADEPVIRLVTVGEIPYPVATATMQLRGFLRPPLMPDEVIIKDFDENAGIAQVLLDAGIIDGPVGHVMADRDRDIMAGIYRLRCMREDAAL